jgi:pyruvate kinase
MQIIAKIDSLDALQNFSSILKTADGVIIQRDELMMELEPEKLILA